MTAVQRTPRLWLEGHQGLRCSPGHVHPGAASHARYAPVSPYERRGGRAGPERVSESWRSGRWWQESWREPWRRPCSRRDGRQRDSWQGDGGRRGRGRWECRQRDGGSGWVWGARGGAVLAPERLRGVARADVRHEPGARRGADRGRSARRARSRERERAGRGAGRGARVRRACAPGGVWRGSGRGGRALPAPRGSGAAVDGPGLCEPGERGLARVHHGRARCGGGERAAEPGVEVWRGAVRRAARDAGRSGRPDRVLHGGVRTGGGRVDAVRAGVGRAGAGQVAGSPGR